MRRNPAPLAQDLVLVGGGHAHALVLTMWAMNPLPGARLTLVSPQPTTPYTGMLPGVVAGHYAPEEHEIDLVRLARRAGARLILDHAVGLDLEAKALRLSAGRALDYDVLSLDIGSSSEPVGVAGDDYAPVKPFGRFLPAFDRYLQELQSGARRPHAAVMGGGVGGVELGFALAHRLRNHPDRSVQVLARAEGAPAGVSPKLWRRIAAEAEGASVRIFSGFDAVEAREGRVVARDGRVVEADLIVAAAGARAAPWLAESGLALDQAGFIVIDRHLNAKGRWDVFAAGDVAAMEWAKRPKAGVFAVRQAPVLHANLRRALIGGGPMAKKGYRAYAPQKDYLKLVSLGGRAAIAEKSGLTVLGRRIWTLKDRIDRAFMRKFDPQPMPSEPALREVAAGAQEARDPLCGGCGAKLGAGPLEGALRKLGATALRVETALGPGDDAALLRCADGGFQAATIDQLRAFTEDQELFAEIATQHALSDIYAMGGAPQAALLSLTLPEATPKMQERMAGELLAGARRALSGAGVDLIGGHSAIGAELSLGVAALGRVAAAARAQLSGAMDGDALILTKPIGFGVILAGEMRQQAPGGAVAAALEEMRRSNAQAADALLTAGARAMTDVTGFGLLGHLGRMLPVAQGADLVLDAIPFAGGAHDLAARKIRSSLYPANAAALAELEANGADPALLDLLVDPQTSGGLLAALPPGLVSHVLAALPGAAQIGVVRAAGAKRFSIEPRV